MRSVSVVLPESMCAEMPMFRMRSMGMRAATEFSLPVCVVANRGGPVHEGAEGAVLYHISPICRTPTCSASRRREGGTNRHNIDPRMSLGVDTAYRPTATPEPIRNAARGGGTVTARSSTLRGRPDGQLAL